MICPYCHKEVEPTEAGNCPVCHASITSEIAESAEDKAETSIEGE